jgi:hypothetical protein
MNNLSNLNIFIKYIFIGVLSGYLLIYGLRPATPYPEFVLELYDNIWLLVITVIITFYAYIWDKKVGILLLLSLISLIIDMIQFTN